MTIFEPGHAVFIERHDGIKNIRVAELASNR
jgi:hypothetical protein